MSFDRDSIDGVPAARFAQRLKDLIESGFDLIDQETSAQMKVWFCVSTKEGIACLCIHHHQH
jgi:hypothetical protein